MVHPSPRPPRRSPATRTGNGTPSRKKEGGLQPRSLLHDICLQFADHCPRVRCYFCGKIDKDVTFLIIDHRFCSKRCRKHFLALSAKEQNKLKNRNSMEAAQTQAPSSSKKRAASLKAACNLVDSGPSSPVSEPSEDHGLAMMDTSSPAPPSKAQQSHTFHAGASADQDEESQVFSTEFISAMHVDDSVHLSDFKVISDNWKQKYNDPIQVSSGAIERNVRAPPRPVSPPCKPKPFERSSAYIRLVANQDITGGLYDLDTEDEAWITVYNRQPGVMQLQSRDLERLIFAFERQAYDGLLRQQHTSNDTALEYDSGTVCDVCLLAESSEGNEMIFCDGCNICAHQCCYGVAHIPEGSWYCEPCEQNVQVSCALCPVKGGALKPTNKPGVWAHLACALWIPEVTVSPTVGLIDISKVPTDRKNLTCSICKTKDGACIQCSIRTCTKAFHVMCAINNHERLDLAGLNDADRIRREAFCKKHASTIRLDGSRQQLSKRKSTEGNASPRKASLISSGFEFCEFVSIPAIEEDLEIAEELITPCFAYWVLKRRRQRDRPLVYMSPLVSSSLLVPRMCISHAKQMRQFIIKGAQRSGTVHGNAEHVREVLNGTRLSLEKARSLCEMVRRRETKKRELLRVMRAEFGASVNSFCQMYELDSSALCGPDSAWAKESKAIAGPQSRRRKQNFSASPQENMQTILNTLRNNPVAAPFALPVDTDLYSDYLTVISIPMDLSTIQGKLSDDLYTYETFASDVDLIFSNCFNYNEHTSQVFKDAKTLQTMFNKWKRAYLGKRPSPEKTSALICGYCGKEFKAPGWYARHMAQHDAEMATSSTPRSSNGLFAQQEKRKVSPFASSSRKTPKKH